MGESNTWPGGSRHAMTQTEHETWNGKTFPGTRQLCTECGEPTGRCEDDSLYADEDGEVGPICEECWSTQTTPPPQDVKRPQPPELQSNYDLQTNPDDYIEWYDKDDVVNFADEWEEYARDLRKRVATRVRALAESVIGYHEDDREFCENFQKDIDELLKEIDP